MVDTLDYGRLPRHRSSSCGPETGDDALAVCPGVGLAHSSEVSSKDERSDLAPAWGPVLGLWEGHAVDPEIRFAGSSGGVASALALHAIEQNGKHGLCHIDARRDIPYLNGSVLSTCREEILAATGSRYAPASPCEGLNRVEDAPGACVFVGKPCDVAATHKARAIRPKLDEKLALTIGIFCAGTPTLEGSLEMMNALGASDPQRVQSVRYRGRGWPGNASVVYDDAEGEKCGEMTYAESWGEILQKHRLWRCHICADHSGEFADIAVGDPWYRTVQEGELGSSLIVVRTQRGLEALRAAIRDGYVEASRVEDHLLPDSQRNLLRNRGAIWGRLWALRVSGIPVPRYRGMPMFRFWLSELNLRQKLASFVGTIRRIGRRQLTRRVVARPYEPGNR
ncbi:MAG: coenzyme F420 hydrogenase [bacterium]|nr:coenzyme F420 hydrogenase [bacterium]